jgi:uncharacterized protein (DUF934 family)
MNVINPLFRMQKGRQIMFKLIKDGRVVSDEWKILTLAEGDIPSRVRLPVGPVLVPLSVWQARRAELIHREYEHGWPLGIWLAAAESAEAIARDIDDFTVIAVELNRLAEHNSYSTARLLRERYAYKGELRATGDVSRNKLSDLHQAGFDTFALPAGKSVWADLSDWFDFRSAVDPGQQPAAAAV